MQIPILWMSALMLAFFSQTGRHPLYSIRGLVTLGGGAIERPVLVYLEPLAARPVRQVYTDGTDRFMFNDVPVGTYYVRVKVDGFEEFAQRIETPFYGRDVVVFLQRKVKDPPSPDEIGLGSKFQVDVRQLSIPDNALREYQRAIEDDEDGKTNRAVERFRKALSIAPNFIEAAFRLGKSLYNEGRFGDAEKALARALKMAPTEPQLRLMLANIFIKQGRYEQALNEIEAYLKENPDGPERNSAEATRSQLIETLQR